MNGDTADPAERDAVAHEWRLYRDAVDPIARKVLAADDSWDAYNAANEVMGVLVDHLTWLPHGGAVYVAWAGLTDLYEIGSTTLEDAHRELRRAALAWLDKPLLPSSQWLNRWTEEATVGDDGPAV